MINQFLEEIGFTDLPPVYIHEDNESSLQLFETGFLRNHASKHYEPRYFFLTSPLEEKLVTISHITTSLQIADVLTKGVGKSE